MLNLILSNNLPYKIYWDLGCLLGTNIELSQGFIISVLFGFVEKFSCDSVRQPVLRQ